MMMSGQCSSFMWPLIFELWPSGLGSLHQCWKGQEDAYKVFSSVWLSVSMLIRITRAPLKCRKFPVKRFQWSMFLLCYCAIGRYRRKPCGRTSSLTARSTTHWGEWACSEKIARQVFAARGGWVGRYKWESKRKGNQTVGSQIEI